MIRATNTAVALAFLAALPLAACGGVPAAKPDGATPAASDSAASAEADSKSETAAMEAASASAVATAAVTMPKVPRAPIVPLAKFPGLSDGQVTGMLGTPQFRRQDAGAELWQYRGDGCVLHLFLYREKDGLRVRHAEVRPRTTPGAALTATAAEACLTKLSAAPPAATS